MKKYLIDYIAALVCSIFLGVLIFTVIAGGQGGAAMVIGFILPIGYAAGVYFSRKRQQINVNWKNVTLSVVITFISCFAALFLMDLFSGEIIVIIIFILPVFAIIGFDAIDIYKKITSHSFYIKHRLLTIILIIAFIIASLYSVYFILGIISYGSYNTWLDKCAYSEEILKTPNGLKNTEIVLEKDAYVIKGKNHHSHSQCTKTQRDLAREIKSPKFVSEMNYPANKGKDIEKLSKGKIFTLEKIVALWKHGIGADHYSYGPLMFLVLKDENNIMYYVYATELDWFDNKKQYYLGYYKDGKKLGDLSWYYFRAIKK